MVRTERQIITSFRAIRACTPSDGQRILELNPSARVFTIPPALDPDLYPLRAVEISQPTVGLIGSMAWRPGYLAAVRLLTSIWPRLKAEVRDARLMIVGWGARRALSRFLDRPDVTIMEDVPDAEPYFRQLSVLAYPAPTSSGLKVKVQEAMAYGVPVVTTSQGIEGIEAIDGVHAMIADQDDVFADKVVASLRQVELRNNLRLAARKLIEERYSPGPTLSQIENLYGHISRSSLIFGVNTNRRRVRC
jgi:glycosyltransferase involved in cell wall biosynthesis